MRRLLGGVLAIVLAASAASADDAGHALSGRWCARCHGDQGDGRGLAAPSLALNGTPPRDFTSGVFKWKSTRSGEGPTDDDIRRTIERGLAGTPMPFFGDLLSTAEIGKLAVVVRGFARRPATKGAPVDLGPMLPDGEAARARGREVFESLECARCHGAAAPELRNDDGSVARPADLSRPWTFRGGAGAADVALRLATGIAGTPMPSYLDTAPLSDLWAVAHYVRSLARASSLREASIAAAGEPPGAGELPAQRGEYLVKAGTCFLCHVRMQDDGSYEEASYGAGGMRVEVPTLGTVFSRNLTPDPGTGLGGWGAEDLRRVFREGRSKNGRYLSALDMPWVILAELEDSDVDAIFAHLRSLPPVVNLVPPPERAPLRSALWDKLGMLVRGEMMKEGYYPGNAGISPGKDPHPEVENPNDPFVFLAILVTPLLVAWLRLRRRAHGRVVLLLLGLCGSALFLLYVWPPLRFLPADFIRARPPYEPIARLLNFPPVVPPPEPVAGGDPGLAALARRGRYVATFATCSFCHTTGPSITQLWAPFPQLGGGMKVNWRIFGTVYSRNLTPDLETGLGRWTDDEIRRAITSGITREGRLMHWQAMPWDHFSAMSPEDLEALVFYLRSIPPVYSKVPPPEPPKPGDEEADTFTFGYTGEYGSGP